MEGVHNGQDSPDEERYGENDQGPVAILQERLVVSEVDHHKEQHGGHYKAARVKQERRGPEHDHGDPRDDLNVLNSALGGQEKLGRVEHEADIGTDNKEGGLIRELSSNFKPIFHPCTVFRHAHSHRVHSTAAGPLTTALYTTEREG